MARATIDLQDFLTDPFGTLAHAREAGWLADMAGGLTGVVTYGDVRELLSDPRLRANFTTVSARRWHALSFRRRWRH